MAHGMRRHRRACSRLRREFYRSDLRQEIDAVVKPPKVLQ
jgi:hypothetical protein